MHLQSTSNYNSYQQPNFQKLIVRPKAKIFHPKERCEVLPCLENIIRNSKSIQDYAKILEERAELFGLPKVDLIVEYGESLSGFGKRCINIMGSDTMYPNCIADEGNYTIPLEERSVYKQMEKFDCSHIVNILKNGQDIQNGLMKNYLA